MGFHPTLGDLVTLPATWREKKADYLIPGTLQIVESNKTENKQKMSDSNLSMGEETQLLIVDDLDEGPGPGPRYFSGGHSGYLTGNISPPPLIGLDRPGPPNVAMLAYPSCSRYCR